MASRALPVMIGLWLAGCAASGTPSHSAAPLETAAASPEESPAATEPPPPTCEPASDGGVTQTVPGTANIFGAGRDAAPGPGGGGGGTLPPVWDIPEGSTTVSIPCAVGEVTPFTDQPLMNGPNGDGLGAGGERTDVESYDGISGIVNHDKGMFLVGVFLTDAEPEDPAPERLDFTNAEEFDELSPEIGQTFFVGDGEGRTFRVPAGATRFFLGFADAFLYEGAPGWYGNNGGALSVTVAVESE